MKQTIKSFFQATVMAAFLVTLSVPVSVSAATVKPTCSLRVVTPDGETSIKSKEKDVYIKAGDQVTIVWDSKNANAAEDSSGNSIELSGTQTNVHQTSTSYSYEFTSGSKKITCGVNLNVLGGSFDSFSLSSASSKPTISGTATGTKTVKVVISSADGTKSYFKSKSLKVRNGEWDSKVSKKLSYGSYSVVLTGSGGVVLSTGVLNVSEGINTTTNTTNVTNTDSSSSSTIVVSSVPLLFGGTVRAGSSVSVSYLQVSNISKDPAVVKGFSVKQNGNASVESIIGFTSVDDKNGSRGSVGGVEGATPFKNGIAFVPVTNVTLASGEMKLFTIKAVLTKNAFAHVGKQLMIDVVAVDSNAKVMGTFPIRGTTWSVAN